MKNRMTISIPFSFKGEEHAPACDIDLDLLMERDGALPCLYTYLAEQAGISPYSYEHDVMMMSEMEFSEIEGLASDHIDGNQFHTDGFENAWHAYRMTSRLQEIATTHMGIENIETKPELKKALQEAFELGKQEGLSLGRQIRSTPAPGF